MEACYNAATQVYTETSSTNPRFKKIYENLVAFRSDSYLWWQVAEMTFEQIPGANADERVKNQVGNPGLRASFLVVESTPPMKADFSEAQCIEISPQRLLIALPDGRSWLTDC